MSPIRQNISVRTLAPLIAVGVLVLGITFLFATTASAVGSNGSFESGSDPGSFTTVGMGSSTIADWQVSMGSVDYIGSYWQASQGSRSLDLNGSTTGAVSQTIPTVVGATYDVTFDLSGNPDGGPSVKGVAVSATGASTSNYTFDTASSTNTRADMNWEPKLYSFVASASSTELRFESTTLGAFGPALDNVAVETVPTSTPATTTLTVVKTVVNDNGGTATTSDFTLFIDNATTTSGTAMAVATGTHMVSEATSSNYAATFGGDCNAEGSVTLAAGEHKTCTITNNDIATTTPPEPPATTTPPTNACATPGVAPAGFTLRQGSSGHDSVTLAPNTMFVGKGGNDHVRASANGNYIVCTGSGNDHIELLGEGSATVDAGGGNNMVRTRGGSQHIVTGSGNDMVDAGDGDDTVTTNGGNDQVRGQGGNDNLNTGGGNDSLSGGAGTDTCDGGGGINNTTGCEL